jgi:hypothetical protein
LKRVLLPLVLLLACSGAAAPTASASPSSAAFPPGQCGLPSFMPHWIDFADGSVPFWKTFARPGIIAAASNLIFPPQLRQAGAYTIYWDMYLKNRVGQPNTPKPADTIVGRANSLFDYAVQSTGCATPLIAENELFGAGLVTPWSDTNARYRANVLLYLQTLAQRGARPFLLVSAPPYTGSEEAADWWRAVARVADIVQEVYFPAPALYKQGPLLAGRRLRMSFRKAILTYTALGIPTSDLGIMLGFQTGKGKGGREGLAPEPWFQTVKWQVLAARQVGAEVRMGSIWSWGWRNGGTGDDDVKATAACVYLWTRAPSFCDAPRRAGPDFDTSRTEGQIRLAGGVQCAVDGREITFGDISRLQSLTGDRELAFTAVLARLVESEATTSVSPAAVLAAERTVIALRFGGNAAAYRAALAQAGANVTIARGVIADEIRHGRIEATLPARRPSAREVSSFYGAYPDLLARPVHVTPAPWWLGGRKDGIALSSLAPARVFKAGTGRRIVVRDLNGRYDVRVLGPPMPLGALPLQRARPAIAAALEAFARGEAFERWTVGRQEAALRQIVCRRDDLPAAGAVELSSFLPFLSLTGGSAAGPGG